MSVSIHTRVRRVTYAFLRSDVEALVSIHTRVRRVTCGRRSY